MSAWLKLLGNECEKSSLRAVGARIGYSSATISMVLKGTYKGDIKAVERAVNIKLGNDFIDCPMLGNITADICTGHQTKPFSSSSSFRIKMFKACRECPNNTKRRG